MQETVIGFKVNWFRSIIGMLALINFKTSRKNSKRAKLLPAILFWVLVVTSKPVVALTQRR